MRIAFPDDLVAGGGHVMEAMDSRLTIKYGVTKDELDDLYELEKSVYSKDMLWPKNEFKKLARSGHTWVVKDDGVPVALMIITVRRGVPYIDTIEVDEDHRGMGIAGRLMATGEDAIRNDGYDEMRLEVASDNPAKDIYLAKGYETIRVQKNYYSKGHDALIMAKPL